MPPQARPSDSSSLCWFFVICIGVPLIAAAVIVPMFCMHQVDEGHIGLYWHGGALMPGSTEPGIHFKLPIITTFANVQTTLQTDVVRNIPCGTSGGVMIYFDKIEVVNRLERPKAWKTVKDYGVNYDKLWIFDKIHHEINQFCSAHTLQEVYIDKFDTLDESLAKSLQFDCTKYDTGIEIVAIRVTKPRIPTEVERNYQQVEEQKTRLLIATQEQMVISKQAETLRMQARIQAEKEAEVSVINARREAEVGTIDAQKMLNISLIYQNKLTSEAEAQAQREVILTETQVRRENALADAYRYRIQQEAEANSLLLTPAYLQRVLFQSIANNTKIYFGNNIPQIFSDWSEEKSSLLKSLIQPISN